MHPEAPETRASESPHPAGHNCPRCGLNLPADISICPDDGTFLGGEFGEQLANQYELIEEIGSGANGIVYKALHRMLGQTVAIKMLRANRLDENIVRRFNREAKVISSLDHPAIVKLRDYGVTEVGQPYMVLEYVNGVTLATELETKKVLNLSEFHEAFQQCCDALEHAHIVGVVHRDLKPSNIIFEKAKGIKIVDFGIAKVLDLAESAASLTKTGETFGSPKYMSPEQASGKRVDHRSDIYSLGVVMFESLAGKAPFQAESPVALIAQHLNEEPPDLIALNASVSHELEDIVFKCLAKDPLKRYQSMNDLRIALESSFALSKLRKQKKDAFEFRVKKSDIGMLAICAALLSAVIGLGVFMVNLVKPPEVHAPPKEMEDIASFTNGGKLAHEYFRQRLHEKVINLDKNFSVSVDVNDDSLTEFDNTSVTEDLTMRGSKIEGPGLAHLIHLPLRRLAISTSNLGNRAAVEIRHMPKLETLDISGTNINDQGLTEIVKVPNLKWLYLKDEEHITNSGLAKLQSAVNLEKIVLSKNDWLNGEGIANLKTLPRLKILRLDRCRVNAADLAEIKGLKHLEVLTLRDSKVDDDGVKELENTNLQRLDLQRTKITDKALQSLAKMRSLKEVGIHHCNWTPKAVAALQRARPALKIWKDDDVPFNNSAEIR